MNAVDLAHGSTRPSGDVAFAWQGDNLTAHYLDSDGAVDGYKLWRDDAQHAEFDTEAGEISIDLAQRLALIDGRAYGIALGTGNPDDDVPLALIEPAEIPPRSSSAPGLAWAMLSAILSRIDSGNIAEAEHAAHTALPQYRAAMLGMLADATRLLATAEEQTPDAPLVIDPRINGLFYVTAGGLPALEIHAGRGSDPELYTITEDGEYVRLPR